MALSDEDYAFAELIISEIFEGSSLQDSLRKHGTSRTRFFRIVDENLKLQLAYARAQESRSHIMADEVVTISDDPTEDPHRARNRMQARQWAAAKINPGKYSDRIDIAVTHTASITDALSAAAARVLPLRDQAIDAQFEVVECTGDKSNGPTGSKPVDESDT